MNADSELAKLMANFPRQGIVKWIGIRPKRRAELEVRSAVEAIAGHGLGDDHYATKTNGKRQVTLIQAQHLAVVSQLLGTTEVLPAQLRRNIVVSGISLFALRTRKFRIGEVLLEGAGVCEPCSRMEEVLRCRPGLGVNSPRAAHKALRTIR